MLSTIIFLSVPSEIETQLIELSSDLLNGSVVLLPANQSQLTSDSVSVSCSIINQGRFQWQWSPENYATYVSTDTRSTTIQVPGSRDSVGEYTCTVSYYPAPISASFTVDIERK